MTMCPSVKHTYFASTRSYLAAGWVLSLVSRIAGRQF